ncbi:MAG: hypothetical protein AAFU71_07095 [Cyanobacteria bacterium J06632_22]
MPALQMSNDLGLPPPSAQPSIQPMAPDENIAAENTITVQAATQPAAIPFVEAGIQTTFTFELPTGYIDAAGQVHRQGVMRLARTADEIEPMSDPRVQANPAYATVIILARVIQSLGALPTVSPIVIEGLFAGDLNYLQNFYRDINGLPH